MLTIQQAELQEGVEGRGERVGGVQAHKRMVASLEKQITVQEKKLDQVGTVYVAAVCTFYCRATTIQRFKEILYCKYV